ncbi:MAG: TetR/AcrR family transcriptional regulator [Acidiferrobacterales bacterium]
MTRPSRHTDQRLIQAAHELLDEAGCTGLNLREVAARAGVNLGMFHYHFKTKQEFCRRVLQDLYDRFFAQLELESASHDDPLENLRTALMTFGRFVRNNRRVAFTLLRDSMGGDALVHGFVRANAPRHIGIIATLVAQCQRRGILRGLSAANVTITLLAAVGLPSIFGEFLRREGGMRGKRRLMQIFDAEILTDSALAERIGLLLPSHARS